MTRGGEVNKNAAFDAEAFGEKKLNQADIDYAAGLLADSDEVEAEFKGIPPNRTTMTLRVKNDLNGRKVAAVFNFSGENVVYLLLAMNGATISLEGSNVMERADVRDLINKGVEIYDAWRKSTLHN